MPDVINEFFDLLTPITSTDNVGVTHKTGTWSNVLDGEVQPSLGWNLISQPKLGDKGVDDFKVRIDQMIETINFRALGIAKNISISGEVDFWQGHAYDISIRNFSSDLGEKVGGIHQEMGHFLLHVSDDENIGDNAINVSDLFADRLPRGEIIRQATIPRANAMMTTGYLRPEGVIDAFNNQVSPFYNARPLANTTGFQATVNDEFNAAKAKVIALGGPDFDDPLHWLSQQFPTVTPGTIDWVFSFRDDLEKSQMASVHRTVNPVRVGNLFSDFWIGKRDIGGKTRTILQYIQKVNIGFNGMEWPHVAVNTLFLQE
ncbi:hypothetical protein C4K68_07830 [Pokkaliibacter plantistimulans]|uniref:Uncharacterized protein n=1 Tax=Proteobacteria bacterium 228 TaxID=2083153 RepID=A0A2S5KSW1_9PROT|nr:hypothetical protein [Pokkaliibacter plantistimulans]PPC77947.1 hypothetical protein C4K68_07830 [Pokkaliibacter plantistimulans]